MASNQRLRISCFFSASNCAELIYGVTPVVPPEKSREPQCQLQFLVRILTVESLCNGRKPADFKVESIVKFPLAVKDK